MKKLLSAILSAFLCVSSMAQEVSELNKGDKAPFTGILFGKEEEAKIRKDIQRGDLMTDRAKLLEEKNKELGEMVNIWEVQAKSSAQQLMEARSDSFWKNALYFTLGIVATVGVAFAVKGAVK